MASDEQACLVRTRSDSENSGKLVCFGALSRTMAYTEGRLTGNESGEPGNTANVVPPHDSSINNMDSNESGELIDYNATSVLAQFHEDAIRQAGCGLAQLRVLLAVGLALAGASIELAVIPFILPSAEIEFCILANEKSWLGMISLLGVCLGAVGWGNLADRIGRRRTLVSCLCVNAVFSTIAAFMPTYGTFMMARFCSAIGSGGILPTSFTYMAELTSRAQRCRWLAPLVLCTGLGGMCAALVARAVVPHTGKDALIENKEHFSAWHRYLLLCTLPILASLVSLIWTQESPRFLLETGREVDALAVYQSAHTSNRIKVCGKGNVSNMNNDSDYRLGELELPGKRRPPAINRVRHSVKMFWHAFFQLFSGAHAQHTVAIGGALVLAMSVMFAVSAYAPAAVAHLESAKFDAARTLVANQTFSNEYYNTTMENVVYYNVTFSNCTLRDMFLSHAQFRNCSFLRVTLFNVKTSMTDFKGCLFANSSLFDTDIDRIRDMEECTLLDTVIKGVRAPCSPRAPLAPIGPLLVERMALAAAEMCAAPLAMLPRAMRPLSVILFLCCVCTPGIYFAASETAIYALEAAFRLLLTLAHFDLTLLIIESYHAGIRCTAHGFILSVVYMGAMVTTSVYSSLSVHGYIVATLVTAVLAVLSTVFSLKVQDTAANLL